jgi:2-oxoglutarate ferredoxin oxidoreductase subunit beta
MTLDVKVHEPKSKAADDGEGCGCGGECGHGDHGHESHVHTGAVHLSENGALNGSLTKQDFASDQETRWCPGCGDYAVLAAVQEFMPEMGMEPEQIVFVTGIGCAGRFTYYMNTYGVHGIHGRAPAFATGLALARPDLSVWALGGDGDMLSIGGNHLIHALRRNMPIKIMVMNNQVYGLTKGQTSPTSERGKVTKSTPTGSEDEPFNPLALAIGAGATFVARTVDRDRKHVIEVLRAAAKHEGAAFVEVYHNCPIFNDEAYAALTDKETKADFQIRLEHGKPIRFGANGERGVARTKDGGTAIVEVAEVGEEALLVHDAHRDDPTLAFSLAHLSRRTAEPTPVGVFRAVKRPVHGAEGPGAEERAKGTNGTNGAIDADELHALMHEGATWSVD